MTPHEGAAEYCDTGRGSPDSSGFYAATNEGRDTFADRALRPRAASGQAVRESEWDLECFGDEAGRRLLVVANEDG